MKFSLSWLRDHLETDASLDRITDTLSAIGLEVEGVANPGAALAPFLIARVVEAAPHPNADRLRACRVDAGGGEVSVVCGAPNARTGMIGVFAPPGSHIPGTGITLKVGEIRGVVSAGMLLSRREMGLGEEHDGIVELPADAPVGTPYAAWAGLDDPVIEIGVTPNRGDALSVRGVARDLAAAGLGTLKPLPPVRVSAAFPSPLSWRIEWPEACPWVLGRVVRGVRNGPSPEWLQRRLLCIGLRPISALVDVTNWFTHDLGRPLHVFDADRVSGGSLTFRRGAGEKFRALNGRDYVADAEDCVIADAAGVQSLAGVMGGAETGSEAGTTSVFIECALFDPVRVALTGRRHQIASDARQRFERGIDPAFLPEALDRATALILELCGGEASALAGAGAEPGWRRRARLRFERLAGFGGLAVPPDRAVASLARLGFAAVAQDAEGVTVDVPSWRNDVAPAFALDQAPSLDPMRAGVAAEGSAAIEAECDLIEEVLRLEDLDTVPPVSLPALAAVPRAVLTPRQRRAALTRRTLAARGLTECVGFSFTASALAARFGDAPASLRLLNPIAADLDQMRPTPLATLAASASRNAARGAGPVALFEVGPGFDSAGQAQIAAGLACGPSARHWSGAAQAPDMHWARAQVWALLAALGVPMESLSVAAEAPAHYHPGQSGTVRQGPRTVLARFGALHPSLLAPLGLPAPAAAFEVLLDAVPEPKARRRAPPDLPSLQPVRRDFSFLVASDVAADQVLRAARGAERGLVTSVSLFDVYEGESLGGGRALAVEVTLQPRERSMTDAEIEAVCEKIVAAVSRATGATLRGG